MATLANNNDNPQAGQGRPLPKKEGDLFKNLVKQYESKQYKKAVKHADAILKKFPQHGETLAMKGLTVYYQSTEKKEEAHDLVKLGLRNDMRSHVCWHVYGLLHRADRNYLEAIKAYKQALRMDADNLQILRDLSLLQIQMRDLSGFVVTRNSILSLKPTSQQHWLAFALSKHLQGDLEGALQVIDIYLGTLAEGSPELERKYQPSELQMYKALLLLDKGDAKATLAHLDSCQRIVVDRGAWLWYRMQCYFAMEEWEEARKVCLLLLQRGATEDYRVHAAYQCAVLELPFVSHYTGMDTVATTQVLTVEQKDLLLQLYRNDLREEFPRSAAIARIPLTLLLDTSKSDGLTKPLDQYIRKRLIKGVPSLAMDLSSLLLMADDENKYYTRATDPADIKSHSVFAHVNSMVEKYIENLQACQNFDTADTEEQDPSIIFWAWFLQVGWLEISGDYAKALEVLTIKCLEHTPTAVDAYEVQARLLSKAGDKQAAVEAIDKGRDLDQQDRYMNNQTTKYMLQANQPETALERIGLFTNNDENTSPDKTLYDMQCSWYELELADCLARQGNYGKSLTKFAAVMKHFEDIHEDQFDFHSYCIRKVTLRAYCNVLDWEDHLWKQPYYRRAAEGTIRLYIQVHDDPSITAALKEPDYSIMSAAEKKKAKAIARKKKKQAEKKAAEAPENAEEEDDGKELLLKNPLEECRKLSAVLSKHAAKEVSTWILQYDVAIRRGKVLMAMQALLRAQALDPKSSDLIARIVDFATKMEKSKSEEYPSVVKEVIDAELPALLGNHKVVADYVAGAASSVNDLTSLPTRIAVAEALVLVGKASTTDAAKVIVEGGIDGRRVNVETCKAASSALKTLNANESCAKWDTLVKARFPLLKDLP